MNIFHKADVRYMKLTISLIGATYIHKKEINHILLMYVTYILDRDYGYF